MTERQAVIRDNLAAVAYTEYLSEQNATSDEPAQAEYDAKKKDYDSIDYRLLAFPADVTSDATEEELAAAMATAKAKAQEMYDKLGKGEDFETLCVTYAPEDKRTDYADSETDKSLYKGVTFYSSTAPYMDWLFEDGRTKGDIHLVTDEEAINTAKNLARMEGIMCGISSGTNVAAALKLAKKLGKGKTVVTVLPDTAERYFSTPLFENE